MAAPLRWRHLPWLAVAIPFVPALMTALYVVVGWPLGWNPFWPVVDLNVSEAAIVRDHAEAVRLIRIGQDPNIRWPVRPALRSDSDPAEMTALEAAVRIRRLELIELLVREGAHPEPLERVRLRAIAADASAGDIVRYFQTFEEP